MNKLPDFFTAARSLALYLSLVSIVLIGTIFLLWPDNLQTTGTETESTENTTEQLSDSVRMANEAEEPSGIAGAQDSTDVMAETTMPDSTRIQAAGKTSTDELPVGEMKLLWFILLVGALGSTLHGLISVSNYIGNKTFDAAWSVWYIERPLVGAILSLIFYMIIRAGLITNLETNSGFYTTLALAGMIGLFSKQALNKLSDIFDAIFSSDKEKNLKNKMQGDS